MLKINPSDPLEKGHDDQQGQLSQGDSQSKEKILK